jgi:hypothetical protein
VRIIAVTLGLATLFASPAQAADTVVSTVARPTTIDAYGDRAVWSAWDPSARAYRLTEYADGAARQVPVRASAVPFDVDLGPAAGGGTLAVYSRCTRPPADTWVLNGRRGCDLYAYDFTRGRERRLAGANSAADERWPTVWGSRIAFTRTYTPRQGRTRRFLYWRPLEGRGASRRLDRGPTAEDAIPEYLDLRGRRVAFVWSYEYGSELRLDTTSGHERRLVRLPGSGAASTELDAQGPTVVGDAVHWALAVGGEEPSFSEIRRFDLTTGSESRTTTRIEGGGNTRWATEGFAQAGAGTSWYVRAAATDRYEVHVATGLSYEPAPPPRIR